MGGALTAGQLRMVRRGLQSRTWVAVPGRVVASSVVVDADPRTRYDGYGSRVVCTYLVRGESHEASALDFHSFSSLLERAHARARRYSPGSTVTVWYDPQEPRRITLRPGVGAGPVVGLLAGLGMLAVAWWFFVTVAI